LSTVLSVAGPDLQPPVSVTSRFREVVAAAPEQLAVQGDDTSYTYGELDRESSRIANLLLDRLGQATEPVALIMPYGARMIAAVLGILKAGKFYVPLDPAFPDLRNRAILADVGTRLLLGEGSTAEAMRRIAVSSCQAIDLGAACGSDADPCLDLPDEACSFVLYTSGTTGTPKGVIGSHRDLLHIFRVSQKAFVISPASRVLLIGPLIFSGCLPWLFGTLLSGATIVAFDIRANGTGAALAACMRQRRVTLASFVPSVFRNLAAHLTSSGERLQTLEWLNLGGDRVLASDFQLYQRLCPDACVFSTGYGMTEVKFIAQFVAHKGTQIRHPTVPVGYPYPEIEVFLLDEEDRPVSRGTPGEFVVRTRFASSGYWRRPDLTAERFRRDGDHTVFYTGDLGSQDDDGCFHHLGRKDNQVKIRGNRVELGEVEAVLVRLPGVRDALAVRHEEEGRELLVAYYIPDGAERPTASALRAALRELLPDYMVPAAYVPTDAFPVNANGKLDRHRLPPPSRREHRI
jgi:amino acid adenylation domain-containing protein